MEPPGPQNLKLELALLGFSATTWLVAILGQLGLLPLAGTFHLDLYPLYSLATVLGWVAGNVYVTRKRLLPPNRYRRRLLMSYFFGPPGLLYLIRALAPREIQNLAPLAWVYALGVYSIFFLVPVTLKVQPRRG